MRITTIETGMTGVVAHVGAFRALGTPSVYSRPRGGWRVTGRGKQAQLAPATGVTVDHNWTGVSVPGRQLCREKT
jgi:hypothetical protein